MRDWERVRREEGVEGSSSSKVCCIPPSGVPRDGGCRVEYFQTTIVTLQSAGKIFKKAVKSGRMLYTIWSQS